jgi:hypothetical protein
VPFFVAIEAAAVFRLETDLLLIVGGIGLNAHI